MASASSLVGVGVRLHELSSSSMPVPESRDVPAGRRDQRAGGEPDPAYGAVVGGDRAGTFMFAQVARLELDELLEQLVARARDVQDTQGRLRGLLRANLEVARGVDTDEVLRHVVDAARVLVNARYAALGVVRQGRLVRFLHAGMDTVTVERIGALPEGKGVLGRLVDYPQPLRLVDIAENVSSVGFPEHHPPMGSFLGVPIRVGTRVFGNLYLTEKQGAAEFSAEDEDLVQALAASAGVAIENAILFAESCRRQAWQSAMVDVTTQLLTGASPHDALVQLVHHARVTSSSDGAAIAVATDDPSVLRVTVTDGVYGPWQDRTFTHEGSVAGGAMAAGRAVPGINVALDTQASADASEAGPVGASVAVPMFNADEAVGVLLVCRSSTDEAYDQTDLDMITTFATQAGVAMQLAQSREDRELLSLLMDREQIAEDLRHRVIDRLFTLGISLQAAVPRIVHEVPRAAVTAGIDELDAVIREIRTTVFSLHSRPSEPTADSSS